MPSTLARRTRFQSALAAGFLVALVSAGAAYCQPGNGPFGPGGDPFGPRDDPFDHRPFGPGGNGVIGGGPFGPGAPGNDPTGRNPFEHNYKCMECGATFTSTVIGGPSHCPNCGVKFIGGGLDDPTPNPFGSGRPAPAAAGGASSVIALGVLGLLCMTPVALVGLVVFLVARTGRRPALDGPYRGRRRPRYRDEYDD